MHAFYLDQSNMLAVCCKKAKQDKFQETGSIKTNGKFLKIILC
jgi:hypothetical protein